MLFVSASPHFLVPLSCLCFVFLFFFNDTATTEIYTLSLHDALPISSTSSRRGVPSSSNSSASSPSQSNQTRSEEHTSELQSLRHLVCRLLLEKKKKTGTRSTTKHQ